MTSGPDNRTVFRYPAAKFAGQAFVSLMIALLSLFFAAAAFFVLASGELGLGLFLCVLTAWMIVLLRYVWRDARATRGWKVILDDRSLELDLPVGRSLTHKVERFSGRVLVEEIECLVTRLESYRNFGMANMHRSYALRLNTGKLILLGEDRALATRLASSFMADCANAIQQKWDLAVEDLGMAEGKAGFLSVLFTAPPPWDAPNLSAEEHARSWHRASLTGSLALFISIVVLILALVL